MAYADPLGVTWFTRCLLGSAEQVRKQPLPFKMPLLWRLSADKRRRRSGDRKLAAASAIGLGLQSS